MTHVGRSFGGPGHLEAACPCPLALCGLVDMDNVSDECEHHPPMRGKTMRSGHAAEDCPRTGRAVVVAMGKTEAAQQAVVDAAAMGEPAGTVNFSLFGALDEYRAAVEHEAAERIREANWAVSFSDAFYVGTGMQDAANLIDPEVQS
ncbi:hypothetical protein [Streptomyces sp. NPDC002952]|uniref:hypothetical protein n=1 Tax=Streptomyces sp. NPDC002952 TaxID=3364673 RepID=UPI0036C8CE52